MNKQQFRQVLSFGGVLFVTLALTACDLPAVSQGAAMRDESPSAAEATTIDGTVLQHLSPIATLASGSSDRGLGVAVGPEGDLFIVGDTEGALQGQASAGGTDAFVARYSASGDLIWLRQFGTAGNDSALAAVVDSESQIWVAGRTDGLLGEEAFGDNDAFVARLSAAGEVEFLHQFGTAADDQLSHGLATDSGLVVFAGTTHGNLAGGGSTGRNVFASAFNSSGELEWQTQLAVSEMDDTVHDAAVGPDGLIYLAMSGDLAPDAELNGPRLDKAYVYALDPVDGASVATAESWLMFPEAHRSQARGLAFDMDGKLVVFGQGVNTEAARANYGWYWFTAKLGWSDTDGADIPLPREDYNHVFHFTPEELVAHRIVNTGPGRFLLTGFTPTGKGGARHSYFFNVRVNEAGVSLESGHIVPGLHTYAITVRDSAMFGVGHSVSSETGEVIVIRVPLR